MKELIENLLKLQTLQFDPTVDAKDDRIAKFRANTPEPVMLHYDRLVARGKKGVAAVRSQVCTGCHMQVPLGVTMALMRGDDIQICETCGRYLYLAPAAVETPEAAKPKRKTTRARKPKPELLPA